MRWIPLVLVFAAVGCGGAHEVAARKATTHDARTCTPSAPAFRTCFDSRSLKPRPTIERMTASGWSVVARSLQPPDPSTQWGPKVWLSPDGRTLLAEWLYACDGHLAVFVPLYGREPRVVTGERDWRKAVASVPLGWTGRGKARVQMLRAWGPGGVRPAGVYLFDPAQAERESKPRVVGC